MSSSFFKPSAMGAHNARQPDPAADIARLLNSFSHHFTQTDRELGVVKAQQSEGQQVGRRWLGREPHAARLAQARRPAPPQAYHAALVGLHGAKEDLVRSRQALVDAEAECNSLRKEVAAKEVRASGVARSGPARRWGDATQQASPAAATRLPGLPNPSAPNPWNAVHLRQHEAVRGRAARRGGAAAAGVRGAQVGAARMRRMKLQRTPRVWPRPAPHARPSCDHAPTVRRAELMLKSQELLAQLR